MPDFVPPWLATLRTAVPSGVGWVHEIKFDGYRIQARLDHGGVRLLTRKTVPALEREVTALGRFHHAHTPVTQKKQ